MNVNIQTIRFDADTRLVEYINRKLEKLTTFHDRIIKVSVFLKLDNVVHTIKDKIAEIRVHVPRHDFFVKSTSKSFEESFDDAFDSIVTQIKRKKQKQAAQKNYKIPSRFDQDGIFLFGTQEKILFVKFLQYLNSLTFAFPKNWVVLYCLFMT